MKSLGILLLVCAAVMLQLPEPCVSVTKPSPIVLIPGFMGSRLEVKDTKPWSFCGTNHKYKMLWVKPNRFLWNMDCVKREMSLVYDSKTDSFNNNTDVEVRVPGFGDTNTVEFLNPGYISIPYLHHMVEYFVDRGYIRGKTIRAAPYDWRLAADELERRGYYHQLKSMIEKMYYDSSQTKVTLVVHSMGGIVSLHFLTGFRGIDQAWKDRYINAYIPLSGAWSGAAQALHMVISGHDDILSTYADLVVSMTRSFESLPWLFPKYSVYGENCLISTPSKKCYTADDYNELFCDIDYNNGYQFYQRILGINPDFPAPNVPTYCYYGVNVDTPNQFTYEKDFEQNTIGLVPSVSYGDGDGTVNIESLEVCLNWSTMPTMYHFKYKKHEDVDHMQIVSDKQVLADIASIVQALPPHGQLST